MRPIRSLIQQFSSEKWHSNSASRFCMNPVDLLVMRAVLCAQYSSRASITLFVPFKIFTFQQIYHPQGNPGKRLVCLLTISIPTRGREEIQLPQRRFFPAVDLAHKGSHHNLLTVIEVKVDVQQRCEGEGFTQISNDSETKESFATSGCSCYYDCTSVGIRYWLRCPYLIVEGSLIPRGISVTLQTT